MRRCLIDFDIAAARRLWAHVAPHLPQGVNDADTIIVLHLSRTRANSVPLRYRAYSHRWLLDNGYPSGLPDWLKPKAERMYPRIVDAVGIAVKAGSPERIPLARAVQRAMSDVVEDHYADGVRDPLVIKPRMMEARAKTLRAA
jgi:hypothetical protein